MVKLSYYLASWLLLCDYQKDVNSLMWFWQFQYYYVATNQMWREDPDRCFVEVRSNLGFAVLNLSQFLNHSNFHFTYNERRQINLQWKYYRDMVNCFHGKSQLQFLDQPFDYFSSSFFLHLISSYTIGNVKNKLKCSWLFWFAQLKCSQKYKSLCQK